MRHFLFDTLGLSGFGAMTYGLYLRFGLADALIVSGGLLLVLALVGARAIKRSPVPDPQKKTPAQPPRKR
ncbi:hypothetical protein FZZ93_01125 [Halomonas eurihalina]|uniref:Uncharacterized protein n=1 Tax=Halomonas eurihalina TaxID=42566 RepID=A0A5D9DF56_HALER|nr:hypothetical protein [Halomonas eurihalina]MDR5858207.1 hypothetical protein [Halomonas eurihalina]TZG41295.1 hypothetical protein FZZ93_01125 [Halomonas eurihalina]